MPVYTVHEPPLRAAEASADPQRLVFVRDGFYVWAFLLTPLWMAWHRLWLVLVLYLVLSIGVELGVSAAGGSVGAVLLAGLAISLLVGLEGGPLRNFTLRRRHWPIVGVVSGGNAEEAELRFFANWPRQAMTRGTARPASAAAPAGAPRPTSEATDVIGLFPEPGAPR